MASARSVASDAVRHSHAGLVLREVLGVPGDEQGAAAARRGPDEGVRQAHAVFTAQAHAFLGDAEVGGHDLERREEPPCGLLLGLVPPTSTSAQVTTLISQRS